MDIVFSQVTIRRKTFQPMHTILDGVDMTGAELDKKVLSFRITQETKWVMLNHLPLDERNVRLFFEEDCVQTLVSKFVRFAYLKMRGLDLEWEIDDPFIDFPPNQLSPHVDWLT